MISTLLICSNSNVTAYQLVANYSGPSFFDNFNFFNGPDPTHGYVYYTSRDQAFQWGLVNASASGAYIGADSWSVSSGSGRASVRLESIKTFDSGLFIASIKHMPQGCGTWPAYWMCGPDWPNFGEIDIIEGVNLQDFDQTTLHTNQGCDMSNVPPSAFTGSWASLNAWGRPAANCYVQAAGQGNNAGCGIAAAPGTYGIPFNQQGGGYFAVQWTDSVIRAWSWPFANAPGDIGSSNPNPDSWGVPYAYFALGPNCPASHFKHHSIIINLTFCGDWAGSVWNSSPCYASSGYTSCNDFVQNNPQAFQDAYWFINYLTIYQ